MISEIGAQGKDLFTTAEGKIPLTEWLRGLRDGPTSDRIVARLDRRKAGLFGDCYAAATKAHKRRISRQPMRTGKTTKHVSPSRPFRAADHLRTEADIAVYIEAMLADGDARAVPVALRTIVDAVGGMAALAEKTGLSRETLYRTLSERGNPRLDTLAVILAAFGLRLTVQPAGKTRARRSEPRPVLA
ncbi:MAG: addiction module antidote protein [Steroidobacteraceae bacterium]